ncbi:hypothetical protein JCM10295v2_006330 [Rhodotorula toruloides]
MASPLRGATSGSPLLGATQPQEQDGSPTPNQEDDDETSEGDEWAGRGSDLPGVPFKTTLKGHIAMETRTVSEEAGRGLAEPYIPRANIAAMPEKPFETQKGTGRSSARTTLQHCAFFDSDSDGIVSPWDVFWGIPPAWLRAAVVHPVGRNHLNLVLLVHKR